jgi:putative Mg2+ transporter-C (MgtC) family protein
MDTLFKATLGLLEQWQWEALLRMLVCAAVGAAIGIERQLHGRAAGLRTHILVCLGSGIVMLASNHFARIYADLGGDSVVRLDPARLAYGVVAGIGFLGAGVIMKHGMSAHGLTTAASLWCTSAIGLAAGLGMYVVAAAGTAMMLFGLIALRGVDRLIPSHQYFKLRMTHGGLAGDDAAARGAVAAGGGQTLSTSTSWSRDGGAVSTYIVRVTTKDCDAAKRAVLASAIERCPGARQIRVW